jgi:osmotically-inducible protein OsmY
MEDVCDQLANDYWIDASEIEVEVKNGEVLFKGTVSDKYKKRRAEEIAERISGVTHVENRILY